MKVPGQFPPYDVLFENKSIPIDPSCLRSNPLRRKLRDEETKYLPNEERQNFGTRVSRYQILQGPCHQTQVEGQGERGGLTFIKGSNNTEGLQLNGSFSPKFKPEFSYWFNLFLHLLNKHCQLR